MFRFALLLIAICSLTSCNEEEAVFVSSSLVGTWELTDVYADPGDGSGTYQPVVSDKVVVFRSDGTYRSNGTFCQDLNNAQSDTRGTYSLAARTLDPECETFRSLPFAQRGDTLEITFFCIEGCGERYGKVSDAQDF